jgi:AcrR family transcriptional regulator
MMPDSNITKRPHSGGRPPRAALEELDARMIACASRLFMERGYAGVSIEAVAAAAGVGKNTIYRRHATKAGLFQAVVDDQIRTLLTTPEEIAEGDLKTRLNRLAVLLVEAALSPETTAFQRLIIAEAERFPEIAAICLEHAFRPAVALARSALAQDGGEGNLDFAARQFVAAVVYGPHLDALMGRRTMNSANDIARYAEKAVRLFLDGWR